MCRGLKEKIKSRWYFHGIQHHRWRYYWGHHDLSYNNVFDPFKVIRLRVFWKYCFLIDLSNFAPADPSPGNNTTIPETATASPATPKMPCALKGAVGSSSAWFWWPLTFCCSPFRPTTFRLKPRTASGQWSCLTFSSSASTPWCFWKPRQDGRLHP